MNRSKERDLCYLLLYTVPGTWYLNAANTAGIV
jgi:hypothetical protein